MNTAAQRLPDEPTLSGKPLAEFFACISDYAALSTVFCHGALLVFSPEERQRYVPLQMARIEAALGRLTESLGGMESLSRTQLLQKIDASSAEGMSCFPMEGIRDDFDDISFLITHGVEAFRRRTDIYPLKSEMQCETLECVASDYLLNTALLSLRTRRGDTYSPVGYDCLLNGNPSHPSILKYLEEMYIDQSGAAFSDRKRQARRNIKTVLPHYLQTVAAEMGLDWSAVAGHAR